ncbi:DUF4158 domain-containing protein [Clostridium sp. 1001271B_151109_B4]|uniref:DUF4158 domain-containing protein n=1 Tax=Clostridium sp. 1001271B_151109_B4 TaxID=2787148 RepID=UPI0018AA1164|nr:DUF4158 domain-containing protein [Clostridium sp. 1001271B_151109_B4]
MGVDKSRFYNVYCKVSIGYTLMKHRKEENNSGFAIQVVLFSYPDWLYNSFKYIPENIIEYIVKQVVIVPKNIERHYHLWKIEF